MKSSILKIHPADTVLVALKNLQGGEIVEYNGHRYRLTENIPPSTSFI
jgi:hypothetical protein